MKKLLKYILYFVFFTIILAYFIPKSNLYFLIQKEIKQYKIELVTDKIINKYFSLLLEDINLKYKDLDVGTVSNLNFTTYLFKTDVIIKDIQLNTIVSKFVPAKIDSIKCKYDMLSPDKIYLDSVFKNGSCVGYIDIVQRVVKIKVILSKKLISKYRLTVMMLEKDKIEGEYTYEYKF